jgi:hypothetical protein
VSQVSGGNRLGARLWSIDGGSAVRRKLRKIFFCAVYMLALLRSSQ